MKKVTNIVDARNEIVKCLLTGPTVVLFEKKDGSIRKMLCTLNPKLLPPSKEMIQDKSRNPDRSNAAIAAYDLEKKGWRSFLVENVQFFEILKHQEQGS